MKIYPLSDTSSRKTEKLRPKLTLGIFCTVSRHCPIFLTSSENTKLLSPCKTVPQKQNQIKPVSKLMFYFTINAALNLIGNKLE